MYHVRSPVAVVESSGSMLRTSAHRKPDAFWRGFHAERPWKPAPAQRGPRPRRCGGGSSRAAGARDRTMPAVSRRRGRGSLPHPTASRTISQRWRSSAAGTRPACTCRPAAAEGGEPAKVDVAFAEPVEWKGGRKPARSFCDARDEGRFPKVSTMCRPSACWDIARSSGARAANGFSVAAGVDVITGVLPADTPRPPGTVDVDGVPPVGPANAPRRQPG